jgi:N-acetyl-anhydromuramyl-L-alanine amidase AmpD
MRYLKLPEIEAKFKNTLVDAYAQKWKVEAKGELADLLPASLYMPLVNPHSSHFYHDKVKKSYVCIHATAGVLHGDIGTLGQKDKKLSTQFVVARDGTIYQLFSTDYWSYHLGSSASGGNTVMSKSSIAIEMSNLGPLKMVGDKLVDAYGKDYCSADEVDAYVEASYRGYKYFATYTAAQIASTSILVDALCEKHGLKKSFPKDPLAWSAAKPATSIFGHQNCRKDKLDPGPAFDWKDLG